MSYPNNPQSQWQQPPVQQWSRPPPGFQAPPPTASTNGVAIAALVMSIVFAPVGLILGYIARSQIKRSPEGGWGLTTAALIIGWVQIAPFLMAGLWIVFVVIAQQLSVGSYLPIDRQYGNYLVAGLLVVVITVVVVALTAKAKTRR